MGGKEGIMFDWRKISEVIIDFLLTGIGYIFVALLFIFAVSVVWLAIMIAWGVATEIYEMYVKKIFTKEDRNKILLIRRKGCPKIQRYRGARRELRMAMRRRKLVFPQTDCSIYIGDCFYSSSHMKPFWPLLPPEAASPVYYGGNFWSFYMNQGKDDESSEKSQKDENKKSVAFTTAEKIEKTLNKGESGGERILQNCRNGKPK